MAIAVVVVWGLTYISTKVLIQQGLHPHEIFFYRFLVAYAGIWLIAPRRLLANSWKEKKACWLWLVSLAARFIFILRIRLWD